MACSSQTLIWVILRFKALNDDTLTDEFDNTSWTLTGRIAGLDVVYTGAFTERTADQTLVILIICLWVSICLTTLVI